jgi:predicted ATP-grasp superfamily ATP-dependent carboligase
LSRVFVTDASERAALSVIRSLGRKGIEVVAGDSEKFSMGFFSKYCRRKVLYPSPLLKKSKFVNALLKLVKEESFDLLIPITDKAMVPILERKEDFEQFTKVAAPDYPTAVKVLDKMRTVKIAQRHGIPCPKTWFGVDVGDARKFSKELEYPVVIRPRMKVNWIQEKALVLKVTSRNYAYNPKDFIVKWNTLISILKKVELKEDYLMVQEFITGKGYGVEVLMHGGEPRAIFVHRRLREYPITGGASTLRESMKDSNLVQLGVKLLKVIEWEGIAMVEFRADASVSNPKLIEVNGRFWGSLPLAISSGIDFPYLLYRSAVKEEDFTYFIYKTGLKQRWFAGDFLWLYSSIIDGNGVIESVKEFLQSSAVPDDIISLDDITPICGQILFGFNLLKQVVAGHSSLAGEVIP